MNTDGMNNNDNEFNERNESPLHLSLVTYHFVNA